LKKLIKKFLKEEGDVTAMGYSPIASLSAMVIIGAVYTLGQKLLGLFEAVLPGFS
jgi:Flp pilus assembly pilin Flp